MRLLHSGTGIRRLMLVYLMWQLLAITMFGTLAFGTDQCSGLATGPPAQSDFTATPKPHIFQTSVKAGGPSFRITVRPLLLKWVEGANEIVHAGDIEVAQCSDGKPLQVLAIRGWQPINFGATFEAVDINFDGYLDFGVLSEFAAKYRSKSYWVFDPASGLFVENEFTRTLSENCLGTAWHGGCWKANWIDFDPKKHEIRVRYFIGLGECGPPVDRYRVENNRLINVHREVLDMDSNGCTITISDLGSDTMRLTTVRRFDAMGRLRQ